MIDDRDRDEERDRDGERDRDRDGSGEAEGYVPTEEDFRPTPPKPPGPLASLPTRGALLVPAAFWALCAALSFATWAEPGRFEFATSGERVFQNHQWWTLFSALLAHKDIAHLSANGPMLIIFGWLLRHYFGAFVFPILGILCGALANLITIYFYEPSQLLLGASGLNFALIGMWLVLYMRFDTPRPFFRRSINALGFALAMLFPDQYEPHVSYLAHASGFIVGAIVAVLGWPWYKVRGPKPA